MTFDDLLGALTAPASGAGGEPAGFTLTVLCLAALLALALLTAAWYAGHVPRVAPAPLPRRRPANDPVGGPLHDRMPGHAVPRRPARNA